MFTHRPGLVFGVGRARDDARELRVVIAEGDAGMDGHLSVLHSGVDVSE